MIEFIETSPQSLEAAKLIAELDEYHNSIYPVGSHALDSIDELSSDNAIFIAAYESGTVIGCGAVKFLPEGYAELKRMYVSPQGRGKGIAKKIIETLESKALSKGFDVAKLETGTHQKEALNLYRSFGFRETSPFGNYSENSLSIFMEKELTRNSNST